MANLRELRLSSVSGQVSVAIREHGRMLGGQYGSCVPCWFRRQWSQDRLEEKIPTVTPKESLAPLGVKAGPWRQETVQCRDGSGVPQGSHFNCSVGCLATGLKKKKNGTLMGGIPWDWKIGTRKAEHRMLPKTRGRPHAGLGLTQAEVWGCGGGRLEAGWEQNTALGPGTLPSGTNCPAELAVAHHPHPHPEP